MSRQWQHRESGGPSWGTNHFPQQGEYRTQQTKRPRSKRGKRFWNRTDRKIIANRHAERRRLAADIAKAQAAEDHSSFFEQYYREQGLLSDAEWPVFMATLRKPLPLSFRMNVHASVPSERAHCAARAKAFGMRLTRHKSSFASYLKWCDAWQIDPDAEIPLDFMDWLADFTSLGVLSRQEIVSMIPVSFLNIQPHHKVLDMCASPGSKTSQVLDKLCEAEASTHGSGNGFVVANDVDPKRAYILVRRCVALKNACDKLMVVQHKAQKMPHSPASSDPGVLEGCYDRIVCDVPCCGDGTLRKSPDMWNRWHPGFAIGLHTLQLQIAMRGVALLNVGGLMTYSTCTFNPLENEAVVAAILKRCQGAVELVDVSSQHATLVRRPGIHSWKVFDDNMDAHSTYSALMASKLESSVKAIFRPTMWPDPEDDFPLERCMRLYPHDQDTGGFFVAVLRKVRPLPNASFTPKQHVSTSTPPKKHEIKKCAHAEPTPLESHESLPKPLSHLDYKPATGSATLAKLKEVFGLRPGFFEAFSDRLRVRSTTNVGIMTLISASLRDHVLGNATLSSRLLRPVYMGEKICERDGRGDNLRLTREGANLLAQFAKRNVVTMTRRNMRLLLYNVNSFISCTTFDAFENEGLTSGPCILKVRLGGDDDNNHDGGDHGSSENPKKKSKGAKEKHRSKGSRASTNASHADGSVEAEMAFFPGQYDGTTGKLKVFLQFSKGLEGLPKACAKVYLDLLRD